MSDLDTKAAKATIAEAVRVGTRFSFVRLGDAEPIVAGARLDYRTPEHAPNTDFEKLAPSLIERVDLVGIQTRTDGLFGLLAAQFEKGIWQRPEKHTHADVLYGLDPPEVCDMLALREGANWLLVTGWSQSELGKETMTALGIGHVIHVPKAYAAGYYSEIMATIRRHFWDDRSIRGVLFACGPVKLMLAPYTAEEFDVPAIDIGAIVDCWIGHETRTISKERGLGHRWQKLIDFRTGNRRAGLTGGKVIRPSQKKGVR